MPGDILRAHKICSKMLNKYFGHFYHQLFKIILFIQTDNDQIAEIF